MKRLILLLLSATVLFACTDALDDGRGVSLESSHEVLEAGGGAVFLRVKAAGDWSLKLLEGRINDEANNTTRFAVLSRSQNRPGRTGLRDNAGFILLFTVQNKAGALAQRPVRRKRRSIR